MTNATPKNKSLPVTVTEAETILDDAAQNPVIVAAIQNAASGIKPATRKAIYYVGIALGIVVAAASTVGAAVTGNVGDIVGSIGGLAYSLSNLLAAAHLNVPVANAVENV